jgi:hypothetical protein
MPKPRSIPLDYPRRRFGETVWGPVKSGASSLRGGVVRVFPGLSEAKLAAWVSEVQQTPGVEVEAEELLFAMLLCGVRLGVYGPDLAAVQRELWEWLTWAPRNMPADLAELVVEALTPGLAQAVERRGSKVGPSGASGLKGGRPPLGPAAWAAAVVVDRRLRSQAVKPRRARELTLALAALLLGRPSVAPYEFYRERKRRGARAVARLSLETVKQYEWWVLHDGVRQADDARPDDGRTYPAWRRKHRTLKWVMNEFGSESVARLALSRFSDQLWRPFLRPATREREFASRGPTAR